MSLGYLILVLIIYVLAVARVTRLINFDTITDPIRLWIWRRADAAKQAALEAENAVQPVQAVLHRKRQARWNTFYAFTGCPWCIGFWVALAGAVPVVVIVGWSWWALPPVVLAASYLVGLAAPLSADELTIEQD